MDYEAFPLDCIAMAGRRVSPGASDRGYSEMEEVIREALKRQADNEILRGLMEWVLAQSSQGHRPSTK